jgi:hypothetical protein
VLPALLLGALTGCGSGPGTIGPTGVDELTVPTPSPDQGHFVAEVDNPWLPLRPGTTWTYVVEGAEPGQTVTVTVGARLREIAGVATTPVTTTTTDDLGRGLAESTAWYAQDLSGNVWLFGESGTTDTGDSVGEWLAGVNGAEAGLAMAAEPRVGDGYRRSAAEGVAEDVVSVLSVDETAPSLPGATTGTQRPEPATDVVLTEQTSSLGPEVILGWYAPDVGLVRRSSTIGPDWNLASVR